MTSPYLDRPPRYLRQVLDDLIVQLNGLLPGDPRRDELWPQIIAAEAELRRQEEPTP